MIEALKARLISDWRKGWKFWSVRLQAASVAIGAILVGAPGWANAVWYAIPADVRQMIPWSTGHWLPVFFGALAIASRFVAQPKLKGGSDGAP